MLLPEQKTWIRKMVSGRDEAYHEFIAGLSDEAVVVEIDKYKAEKATVHADAITELTGQRDSIQTLIDAEQKELEKYT